MHDLGARLPCLVDGFSQVGDLKTYGVSRDVIIKVHIEEVAGHRRASAYGKSCCADAGKADRWSCRKNRLRSVMIGNQAATVPVSLLNGRCSAIVVPRWLR
jgi:hypothetical protein